MTYGGDHAAPELHRRKPAPAILDTDHRALCDDRDVNRSAVAKPLLSALTASPAIPRRHDAALDLLHPAPSQDAERHKPVHRRLFTNGYLRKEERWSRSRPRQNPVIVPGRKHI